MRSARGGDPPHPARYARHPLPQRWRGLGSGCYHARQWTLVRTQTALAEADRLAMLYNWPRAIPLYVDAEREFRRLNHRKGVLKPDSAGCGRRPISKIAWLPPHPARGVYPGPLRCAQGRSQRKGERARHPLPQRGRGLWFRLFSCRAVRVVHTQHMGEDSGTRQRAKRPALAGASTS